MIKQDLVEAKASVQTRIDFISGELGRLETQIKGLEEKQIRKQQDVGCLRHDTCIWLLTSGTMPFCSSKLAPLCSSIVFSAGIWPVSW